MAQFTISASALIDTALRHGGAGLYIEADAPGASARDAMALESATDAMATLLMLLRGLNHVAPLCVMGDTLHIALHRGQALLDAPRTGIFEDDDLTFKTLAAIDRNLELLENIGVDVAWLAPDTNHAGLAEADALASRIYDRARATAAAAVA